MKKHLIIILLIAFASITYAQTQPTAASANYRNIFKVSAAMFTRNTFQMGFEHFYSPTGSFMISAGMNYRDTDYEQMWGYGGEAQLKFHVYTQILPKKSHRLYFAPYLLSQYQEVDRNDSYSSVQNDKYSAVGAGVIFGWSFSFANKINLDIYTGGGIRKAFNVNSNTYSDVWDYSYSVISPRLGVDVGFWF